MRAPSESTDFLFVPPEMLDETGLGAHVPHQNLLILGATGDHGSRPGTRTDPVVMPTHTAHLHLLLHVPDLHLSIIGSDREMGALLGPSDASDSVPLAEVDQLTDAGSIGVPDIDLLAQGHRQSIRHRPVHQVQVEVILQVRRVNYFVGRRSYLANLINEDVV